MVWRAADDNPVITPGLAILHPERERFVVGDAALLVDPGAVEGMGAAMAAVVDSASLGERLQQQGFVRAQSFSWETTARKTLNLYMALGR